MGVKAQLIIDHVNEWRCVSAGGTKKQMLHVPYSTAILEKTWELARHDMLVKNKKVLYENVTQHL